ncbi:retrovirus-related pol polyprotein from transposon TNT 1-94 [Tanacetum coccineum]
MNSSVDNASVNVHECEKCLKLETELLNKKDFVEKEIYDKLFKSFTTLEKHCISLEVDTQLNQEIFQRDNSVSNQSAPSFDQLFELNELKAQSQEKDTVIKKLKERIKSLSGKINEDKIKKDLEEIETINIELDHMVSKLIAENEHLKQTYKQLYDSIKPARIRSKEQSHSAYIKHTQEEATVLRDLVEHVKLKYPLDHSLESACRNTVALLTRITTTTEVPLRKPTALENETPKPVVTLVYSRKPRKSKTNVPVSKSKVLKSVSANKKEPSQSWGSIVSDVPSSSLDECRSSKLFSVKFRNDHVAKILGYGDYQIGNVTISRVYYVEGLGHNLFSVGQFCDSNLEVAFRQHTCFIRNLEGVDLLTGSRGNNLYTLSLGDMMASSPICLLSKASKTKSWLIATDVLIHLNFVKWAKSKKKPTTLNQKTTNQENLYLLDMDLYGLMHVASVNGKKYTLVIVDGYSRFTWVKFLRSKVEAPDFIMKFLKRIQVRIKMPVRRIRTDNGTEFVNQTLREYYEKVGISHETSVARSPQQNGVVERRNRTLIEAARTMLIYAKAPLFLWAEAVATACYTQNRSIIRLRHGKTPYELLHDKLPDLSFFHVFGALCYPTNDSENLGKLQPKADIGIFIGYAPTKKAFRIYNRRTRRIIETIHVDFDELTAMASEHSSSGPALHEMTPATISSGLVPNPPPSTPFVPPSRTDWDLLFQPLFDELLTPPPSVDHPAPEVIAPIAEVVAPEPAASTGSPSSTTVDQDAPCNTPKNMTTHRNTTWGATS